jgi:hypothetical protein
VHRQAIHEHRNISDLRISVGVLTRAFPPDLVDEVVEMTGTREQRRRLLPTRLMVYFVLALWLFRGRNSGYGQVMAKLADGLYHRRRGEDLLAGQLDPDGWVDAGGGRRWRQPDISSLSRARGKLGADPLRMLSGHVAGPVAAGGAPGVSCCGLRVISMDGLRRTCRTPRTTTRSSAGPPPLAGTGALAAATAGPGAP